MRPLAVVLGVAVGAVVLGIAAAGLARSIEQQKELDSFVPSAQRVGAMDRSDGIEPTLSWQTVKLPIARAAGAVGPEWQQAGATRDGRVIAYRGVGRALFLTRIAADETRLESMIVGCGTYAVPPPVTLDDRWLQFGISPVDAYLAHQVPSFDIDPCPTAGFWLASGASGTMSFDVTAPVHSTLRAEPRPVAAGDEVKREELSLGPFLPTGTLVSTSGEAATLTLHWPSGNGGFAYSVLGRAPIRSLERTACHALRPQPLGWMCP